MAKQATARVSKIRSRALPSKKTRPVPGVNVNMNVRIPRDLSDALWKHAGKLKVDVSEVVRTVIAQRIKEAGQRRTTRK